MPIDSTFRSDVVIAEVESSADVSNATVCYGIHEVRLQRICRTQCVGRMLMIFTAPDAEAVRVVLRAADIRCLSVWAGVMYGDIAAERMLACLFHNAEEAGGGEARAHCRDMNLEPSSLVLSLDGRRTAYLSIPDAA